MPLQDFQLLPRMNYKHRISLEIGNHKNRNKNPVAKRAVQELEDEILRREPNCRSITPLFLAIVTAGLNIERSVIP